jgi:hypothetical protein
VKMDMSCKDEQCIKNKWSCTWDSFCCFVAIENPCAHYLAGVHSCAKPAVRWCKSGLCPHTWHTSSPVQSHPWFTEGSPHTGKKVKLAVIHSTRHIIACTFTACTPLTQVLYVPRSLPRALRNIRHLYEWSTSSEGACSRSLWNKVL